MVLDKQAELQINIAVILDNARCYDTLHIIFSAGKANLPEKTFNINLSGQM
jgi:hypothetical protein